MQLPKEFLFYNVVVTILQKSDWYNVEPLCNGFIVTNSGNCIVRVNDQILYPGVPGTSLGDSRTFGGNYGEIYRGTVKVAFDPTGTAPSLDFAQKVYYEPTNNK